MDIFYGADGLKSTLKEANNVMADMFL